MAFKLSIISSDSDSFFVKEPVGSSRAATITYTYVQRHFIKHLRSEDKTHSRLIPAFVNQSFTHLYLF